MKKQKRKEEKIERKGKWRVVRKEGIEEDKKDKHRRGKRERR